MDCKKELNLKRCACTYASCRTKGLCCECLSYHLSNRELPGCCFPPEAERTYNRSFEYFAQLVAEGRL